MTSSKRFFGTWPVDRAGNPIKVRFEAPKYAGSTEPTKLALSRAGAKPRTKKPLSPLGGSAQIAPPHKNSGEGGAKCQE